MTFSLSWVHCWPTTLRASDAGLLLEALDAAPDLGLVGMGHHPVPDDRLDARLFPVDVDDDDDGRQDDDGDDETIFFISIPPDPASDTAAAGPAGSDADIRLENSSL